MVSKTDRARKFLVRLPPELHERLHRQAKKNGVSVNAEIVKQLESYATFVQPSLDEAVKAVAETTANAVRELIVREGTKLRVAGDKKSRSS